MHKRVSMASATARTSLPQSLTLDIGLNHCPSPHGCSLERNLFPSLHPNSSLLPLHATLTLTHQRSRLLGGRKAAFAALRRGFFAEDLSVQVNAKDKGVKVEDLCPRSGQTVKVAFKIIQGLCV